MQIDCFDYFDGANRTANETVIATCITRIKREIDKIALSMVLIVCKNSCIRYNYHIELFLSVHIFQNVVHYFLSLGAQIDGLR